jgi:hypothetical protein
MPKLANPRQEDFCGRVASGESLTSAYLNAGFKTTVPAQGGSKLMAKAHIKRRVSELRVEARFTKSTGYQGSEGSTEDWHLKELFTRVAEYDQIRIGNVMCLEGEENPFVRKMGGLKAVPGYETGFVRVQLRRVGGLLVPQPRLETELLDDMLRDEIEIARIQGLLQPNATSQETQLVKVIGCPGDDDFEADTYLERIPRKEYEVRLRRGDNVTRGAELEGSVRKWLLERWRARLRDLNQIRIANAMYLIDDKHPIVAKMGGPKAVPGCETGRVQVELKSVAGTVVPQTRWDTKLSSQISKLGRHIGRLERLPRPAADRGGMRIALVTGDGGDPKVEGDTYYNQISKDEYFALLKRQDPNISKPN